MFDAYHKWLGIPKDQRPPTFYQLLGVTPGEEDIEVIEEAAVRQSRHIRDYQIGVHAEECTRVLNEISQARSTLTNPAKRKQYDATLANSRLSPASATPVKPGQPLERPSQPWNFDEATSPEPIHRAKAKRGGMPVWAIAGGGVAALAVVVLVIVLIGANSNKDVVPDGKKGAEKPATKLPVRFTNSLGMEFALIPKGKSWLGGGGGKPGNKQVEITHDFYLGKYTVTQEQWKGVMTNNPSSFSRNGNDKDKVKGISDAELKQFPVENVSWDEVQEFLKKLNAREKSNGWKYRLPSEAEWEYACRGAATSKEECSFDFYFDQPTNDLDSTQANFIGDHPAGKGVKGPYLARPCIVGSYKPNRLGLYDMNGNVRQWCEGLSDNGVSGGSLPVIRGGSWHSVAGLHCHAAWRAAGDAKGRADDRGFRVARVPVGKEIVKFGPKK